jgi:hypothetical protein
MKLKSVLLILTLTSTPIYAYQANCETDNGRTFSITVKNKVLTVNERYRHPYQGKTWGGWYEYANSKYTYKTGPFKGDGFPIEALNSKGQRSNGQCSFKKATNNRFEKNWIEDEECTPSNYSYVDPEIDHDDCYNYCSPGCGPTH